MTIITGTIADSAGRGADGRIEAVQLVRFDDGTAQVTDAVAHAQVQGGRILALGGGEFSLPPSPAGTAIRIREIFGGRVFEWTARIPDVESIEYRELEPVEPDDTVRYAPPPWVADVLAARDDTSASVLTAQGLVSAIGGLEGLRADVAAAEASAARSTTGADRAEAAARSIDPVRFEERFRAIEEVDRSQNQALLAKADLVSGVVPDGQLNASTAAVADTLVKRGANGTVPGIGSPVNGTDAANRAFVLAKIGELTAKRVERNRIKAVLSGSSVAVGGIYYQDLVAFTYATPFPAPPLLMVSVQTDWSVVQWAQVTEETATGFKVRVMRLNAAPVAPTVTYAATEA